jgi:hypothetical protein
LVQRRLDESGYRHADGGYFGQVKQAEQVRYVPREAFAKTSSWIDFENFMASEKSVL